MKNMLLEHPLHLEATTSTGDHRVEHFSSHVMKLICFSLLNDPVNLWLPSICELNPQEKTQPAIGYPFAVAYHERHLDISQNQAPWRKWTVNNNHQFRGILVLNWLNKLFALQLCEKLTHHTIKCIPPDTSDETMPTSSDLICWRKNLLILLRHLATHNEV